MNKQQFIDQEVAKNREAFGRWGSTERVNSADPVKLITQPSPKNEHEALQHGNALASTGNYPVGTSGCFNVGISGGCGPECYVYLAGECTEPQEMVPHLNEEELQAHKELYG